MIETQPGGIVLSIQAQPKARKNAIVGVHAGRLKVAVTQAPEKGKANDAIIRVLSEALGLNRSQFELLSGQTSSHKRLLVTGIEPVELQRRIEAALPSKKT